MSYTPGPYSKLIYGPNNSQPRMKLATSGFKQPQPIDRSKQFAYERKLLTLEMVRNPPGRPPWTVNSGSTGSAIWSDPNSTYSPTHMDLRNAVNKAYERFVDKMHDTAELGITLATAGQALDMITSRAVQLRRAYSELRRGRLVNFFKRLGIKPLPKHKNTLRTRPRDASAVWLEYWFGWSPLVADIHAAVDALQSDFPDDFVFSSAKQKGQLRQRRKYWYERDINYDWVCSVRIQANVIVSNPNLYRANQLGLVNPAVVVWDVIPFSFVVDWFIPVGNFLRSFSEFVGLRIENASYYQKTFFAGSEVASSTYMEWGSELKAEIGGYVMKRTLGLPSYAVHPKPLKLPSATRAATAISLLVQLFIKP